MVIKHLWPSAWESHNLSVIFVKLYHHYLHLSEGESKRQRDKMTSSHIAFHLTIISFVINRNQSVSAGLDRTLTEARNHYFESLHNTSYSYNRNKI